MSILTHFVFMRLAIVSLSKDHDRGRNNNNGCPQACPQNDHQVAVDRIKGVFNKRFHTLTGN